LSVPTAADSATITPLQLWVARWQIVAAAALWSTSGLFVKAPWFDSWPADSRGGLLAFWRSAFAILILLPLVRRATFRWQMIPMTLCFAVMIWSFLSAMVHGGEAGAIWLQYLSPVWVLILSLVLLKERPQPADWTMFACCFAGVGLIVVMEARYGSPLATGLGILSGLAYAGVILCLRAMRGVDSVWLITLNHSASVLLLSPWVLHNETSLPWGSYLALAFFGVFQMSVPYILFARGLRVASSAEASVLTLVEPLLVPVWVYLAWSQHPGYQPPPVWTLLGGSLILAGLVTRYLPAVLRSSAASDRG
jgi:drug/metabolite transporter, DME family